jgi:hypothetical protein
MRSAAALGAAMALDAVMRRVVGHQALELGRDPHAAVRPGHQRPHPAEAAAGRGVAGELDRAQPVAVVAGQALVGGDPQETGAVLRDRRHRALRHADAAELHFHRPQAGAGARDHAAGQQRQAEQTEHEDAHDSTS